ncbi:MAG: PaaI family thioesterase [Oscillospiraceae bacterium]
MLKKVIKKQINSKDCFVCGAENKNGFKASFYEMEDKSLVTLCTAKWFHQSYPNTVHGGISTALLDETINRAILCIEPDTFGVTVEISAKLKSPVPYDVPLIITGRITENTPKIYRGEGEIILPDGTVAATAFATCVKLSPERMLMVQATDDQKVDTASASDPTEIEIPEALR